MIRIQALLIGLLVSAVVEIGLAGIGLVGTGLAEQAPPTSSPEACPPNAPGQPPPADGKKAPNDLSDRLADSKGVICPPAVDPDIRVKPPSDDGTLRVVPAPGTPGGDPDTQPK